MGPFALKTEMLLLINAPVVFGGGGHNMEFKADEQLM